MFSKNNMETFNLGFLNSLTQSIDKYILDEMVKKASKINGVLLQSNNCFYTIAIIKPTVAIMTAPLSGRNYCPDSKINHHISEVNDFISKIDIESNFQTSTAKNNSETKIIRLSTCVMGLSGLNIEISEAICICFLVFLWNINQRSDVAWSKQFRVSCINKITEIRKEHLLNNLFLERLSEEMFLT